MNREHRNLLLEERLRTGLAHSIPSLRFTVAQAMQRNKVILLKRWRKRPWW